MEILKAAVYVSTYQKYNEGSRYSDCVKLAYFDTMDDFLHYCKQLNNDEDDPELMFLDYENIPESMIGEAYICGEVWDVLQVIKGYDEAKLNRYYDFCYINGYEQDTASVKDFEKVDNPKVGKKKLPHELELKEEYAKIWQGDEGMQKYCMKKVSNCIKTSFGGLVVFEKPDIKTNFCFGYYDDEESYNIAQEACKNVGESQFLHENLEEMKGILQRLEGADKAKLYLTRLYKGSNIFNFYFYTPVQLDEIQRRGGEYIKATEEDITKIYTAQKEEFVKFEKRLKSYLKRYGTSKLNTWTYYAD